MRTFLQAIIQAGNVFGIACFWFGVWLYRAILVSLTGGILGLIISLFIKIIFPTQLNGKEILIGGFSHGIQYGGIWATGIALVWLVMDRKNVLNSSQKHLISHNDKKTA